MRVLAFTKYGSRAASTRQRVLQYLPTLKAAGIEVEYRPLLGDDYVRNLSDGSGYSRGAVVRAYAARVGELLRGEPTDLLWIYAELFPSLPAAFERLAFRRNLPVVYDFDDAFHHHHESVGNPILRRLLTGKLEPLLRGAAAVCCGNEYLRSYAAQFCGNSHVIPTVVDTELYRPREAGPAPEKPVIGWIGSPSNWCNLRPLLPVLERATKAGARVRVIGAGAQAERDRFLGLELIEWSEETEIEEVRRMDIGIMPLLDLPFQRGKSGYKLIQYMACGLPVIASPVGVNSDIVTPGNGILARSPDEWEQALTILLGNPDLRARMGEAGRHRAVELYSLASQAPRLIQIFRSAAASSKLR